MPGFNSAINASLSSMNESSNTTSIVSSNLANAQTGAFKLTEQYCQAIVNSQSGLTGGVTSTMRQLVDSQGELNQTGIGTDLAIEGNGFAIVTDKFINGSANNIYVTRDLSFRKDKTNMLINAAGYYLLAWNVDSNGNLPTTKALLSSLNGVNVAQSTSQATATSLVDFGANLYSQQTVVGNGAATINIINHGLKPSPINSSLMSTDVLYSNPNNSLSEGEGIEITIGSPDVATGISTKKIIYGGFAQTYTFSNTATNLTASAPGNNASDEITIQYGNLMITVTRGTGATNRDVMQNIADQINVNSPSANGVQAQLYNLGASSSISIAPTNINQALTFGGLQSFRNQIGLDDTKNTTAFSSDVEGITVGRFATLKQFGTILNSLGVITNINDDSSSGANLTISSVQPVAFNNYQPLGKGSDFLTEFGLNAGYLSSTYDPYISSNNMAGGTFGSHFSQNITVYDAMGNEHNLLVSFLKTGVNQWAVEIYAVDPLSVNIAGRTDGLLSAGTMLFDGTGKFLSIDSVPQYSYSSAISTANQPLGATKGQTLTINVGSSIYTYNYGDMIASSLQTIATATNFVGNPTDTLNITIGSNTFNIARGNGATNLAVLYNMANQINQTVGNTSVIADVVYDKNSTLYTLNIRGSDSTQAIVFSQTGTVGSDIGITAASNVLANSFQTLYELAEQINVTQGPTAVKASVIPGAITGSYVLRLAPTNNNYFLNFGGSSAVINSPLSTGNSQTIASALGLVSTSSANQLNGIDQPLAINWSNIIGSVPNNITFSFGAFGAVNGMSQVSGNYAVKNANQNGVSTGDLTGISIDSSGWITAQYSNSLTRQIYKIPVGDFANPNGLMALPGNLYMISKDSGPLNLKEAGLNGAGAFVAGSLEGSNVDMATELAKLILAQRQYQASSKVINVVDKLLEDLLHRTFN